jgi:class 3 adenylate cyclase
MSDRTFLFADLAGFTALTEAHGDDDAADVAARFTALARGSLEQGSALVKTIGDEAMIVSDDPASAARTAVRLAAAVHEEERFPGLRAGMHAGTCVERNGDYFGAAVNIAARVAAHARSGQILCTAAVAEAARALEDVEVRPAGRGHFKNVAEPVELFEIVDRSREGLDQEIDPVCHMRLDPDAAPARLPYGDRVYLFCSFECARAFAERPETYAGS